MKLANASLQGVREVNVARSCQQDPGVSFLQKTGSLEECGSVCVCLGEGSAERGWRAEEQFYLEKARRI